MFHIFIQLWSAVLRLNVKSSEIFLQLIGGPWTAKKCYKIGSGTGI
jgi:hypothetical protein